MPAVPCRVSATPGLAPPGLSVPAARPTRPDRCQSLPRPVLPCLIVPAAPDPALPRYAVPLPTAPCRAQPRLVEPGPAVPAKPCCTDRRHTVPGPSYRAAPRLPRLDLPCRDNRTSPAAPGLTLPRLVLPHHTRAHPACRATPREVVPSLGPPPLALPASPHHAIECPTIADGRHAIPGLALPHLPRRTKPHSPGLIDLASPDLTCRATPRPRLAKAGLTLCAGPNHACLTTPRLRRPDPESTVPCLTCRAAPRRTGPSRAKPDLALPCLPRRAWIEPDPASLRHT